MIEIKGITKSFGSLQVLKGIDLSIGKGEVVSIVGPSGAGKTTLLQIIGTLDKADSGTVVIDGTDVSTLKEKELSAFRNKRIGFVDENRNEQMEPIEKLDDIYNFKKQLIEAAKRYI